MTLRSRLIEDARITAEKALVELADAERNLRELRTPANAQALIAIERKAAKRYEDAYASYAELRANTQ